MKPNPLLLLVALGFIVVFLLATGGAAMLPNPQAEPAAWAAMSEVAASSRLFGFLAFLAFGNTCNLLPLLLIPVLLAVLLWRGRN